MAKSTAARTKQDAGQRSERDVRFINYDLTADDKAQFKVWAHENSGQQAFDLIMEVAENGFNISTKFSEFEGCHTAFIVPTPKHADLQGWILSGRGSTSFSAIMGALFRHLVLFESNWPIREDIKRSRDDDF